MTPEEALKNLQAAMMRCQSAGINIRIAPMYGTITAETALVLDGVKLEAGNLILLKENKQPEISF